MNTTTLNPTALLTELEEKLNSYDLGQKPVELYEPVRYILSIGGKRLRPLLTLFGAHLFSEDVTPAMLPALAVEVFHNFTLMHDDIMDKAPLRRGKATVHEKWDANRAILSGDAMLIKAYELIAHSGPQLPKALKRFNECALEVCEGQQYDMNFETREEVEEAEYIEMIRLKTAVLLGYALELGAYIGGGSDEDAHNLRLFGERLGIGFQLKDDLLDVFGEQAKVGKQVGGDIIANKKTFLLIKAKELAEGEDKIALENWIAATDFNPEEKIKAVTEIYQRYGIKALAEAEMNRYFAEGFSYLDQVQASKEKKDALAEFSKGLINREK